MRLQQCILFFLISSVLFGCSANKNYKASTQDASLFINEVLFSSDIAVIKPAELFNLSSTQQQKFLTFYQQATKSGYKPNEAIESYLIRHLSGFTYYGRTYNASDAMRLNQGNCMSLAILTTAFAHLAGVEIGFLKMHSLPIFEKHGNVILSSSHVQSILYDSDFVPEDNYFYIGRPGIIIDYFPQEENIRSHNIDLMAFVAMYYINIASEFYLEGNYDDAFAYTKAAYQYDSNSISALNLFGLLHKSRGDFIAAESFYELALTKKQKNINVMDNYLNLLEQQGKYTKALDLKRKLKNLYDPNPYHWLEKAQSARYQKRYSDAVALYQKVIKMAPYVKQAYAELRDVYLLQGQNNQAIKTLKSSLIWVHDPALKKKYKKQLYQLTTAL